MKNILIKILICLWVILTTLIRTHGQDSKCNFGGEYITEIQTDLSKKANWVNLLTLDASYRPWRQGEFYVQTISTYKARKERIVDDLQTFSNIEEDNMALNISVAGYTHYFDKTNIFIGIRNANEDYFTGDYTSFFTNSSCGIYPTISANTPVANYPLSAISVHAEFRISGSLLIKNSLYNGVAGKLYGSEPSVFNVNPKRDGIFNISELSYTSKSDKHGVYNLGFSFHTCFNRLSEDGVMRKTKSVYSVWGNVEQEIYKWGNNKEIGFLSQASFVPDGISYCHTYFGAGLLLKGFLFSAKPDTFGVFINRADFRDTIETAVELTWRYEILKNFLIQPSLHILTNDGTDCVGLFRLNYLF